MSSVNIDDSLLQQARDAQSNRRTIDLAGYELRQAINGMVHAALINIQADYRIQGGKAYLNILGHKTLSTLSNMVKCPIKHSYLSSTNWDVIVFRNPDQDFKADIVQPVAASIQASLDQPYYNALVGAIFSNLNVNNVSQLNIAYGMENASDYVASSFSLERASIYLGPIPIMTITTDLGTAVRRDNGRVVNPALATGRDGIFYLSKGGLKYIGLVDILARINTAMRLTDQTANANTLITFGKSEKTLFRLKCILAAYEVGSLNWIYNLKIWSMPSDEKDAQQKADLNAVTNIRNAMNALKDNVDPSYNPDDVRMKRARLHERKCEKDSEGIEEPSKHIHTDTLVLILSGMESRCLDMNSSQ